MVTDVIKWNWGLRTTCMKNVKFKIMKIRTGCEYVGYFYYSENLNWATQNFRMGRGSRMAELYYIIVSALMVVNKCSNVNFSLVAETESFPPCAVCCSAVHRVSVFRACYFEKAAILELTTQSNRKGSSNACLFYLSWPSLSLALLNCFSLVKNKTLQTFFLRNWLSRKRVTLLTWSLCK